MSNKDPNVFLAHARQCIVRIEKYATEGEKNFLSDDKTQDAILRNLEIVGQCIKDAGIEALESTHPDIPWRDIADFRNVLAHAYLGVKPSMVWAAIINDLPSLHQKLDTILENWLP